MRENRRLELKERVANTFLKTVSAYANYGTGEILFGVTDDGAMVGLEDPTSDCLRIGNAINDGISPRPEFSISENSRTGVVTLRVLEGDEKPYLYRSKAYKRSDASTVEVDDLELRRLVLEGSNLTFDAVRSARQDLSFDVLSRALEDEVGVSTFGDEERALSAFSPGVLLSSSRVVALTGFGKDKVLRVLKGLVTKGLVSVQGSGRGTRYVMS
ncbi:MAG: ATP-binding protein [Atopobiaceae bacterium]|nr:ATP-binding protein [Atopobiaceae bacterium]MBR3313847.1 ATP-binding protein [Atopobiaceae bacterium]